MANSYSNYLDALSQYSSDLKTWEATATSKPSREDYESVSERRRATRSWEDAMEVRGSKPTIPVYEEYVSAEDSFIVSKEQEYSGAIHSGSEFINDPLTDKSLFSNVAQEGYAPRYELKTAIDVEIPNPKYQEMLAAGWSLSKADGRTGERVDSWYKVDPSDRTGESMIQGGTANTKPTTNISTKEPAMMDSVQILNMMSDQQLATTAFELLYGNEGAANPVFHPWEIGYELSARTGYGFPDFKGDIKRSTSKEIEDGQGKNLLLALQKEEYKRLESVWGGGNEIYNTVFPGYTPGEEIRHISGGPGGVFMDMVNSPALSIVATIASGGTFPALATALKGLQLGQAAYSMSKGDAALSDIIGLAGGVYGFGGQAGAWTIDPTILKNINLAGKTIGAIEDKDPFALIDVGVDIFGEGKLPEKLQDAKKILDTGMDVIRTIDNPTIGGTIGLAGNIGNLFNELDLTDTDKNILNTIGKIGGGVNFAENLFTNPSVAKTLYGLGKFTGSEALQTVGTTIGKGQRLVEKYGSSGMSPKQAMQIQQEQQRRKQIASGPSPQQQQQIQQEMQRRQQLTASREAT